MPNARIFTSQHSLFATLKPQPPDPLLSLIAESRRDPREHKIDLGVGVYRDEHGVTPVLRAVKSAERWLLDHQSTKSYLGPEGDVGFVELLKRLVCGDEISSSNRLVGVQTPGGTGALRLAAELIAACSPGAKIWLGLPAWPNHHPIFTAAGISIEAYHYFDIPSQRLCFDEMIAAIKGARPGDVVLLQGCCHNPTGADFDITQWIVLGKLLAVRGLVPLIDLAYHGLGRGLAPDAVGIRVILEHVSEVLIAYSCDKNFGLYRERTGALFAVAGEPLGADLVFSNILSLARANWSMPPDHGAAVVRLILESEELTADWKRELEEMRKHIMDVRERLSTADASFAHLRRQYGMFSVLPIDSAAIARLKIEHGIYMVGSGRINVAGLRLEDIQRFAMALRSLMEAQQPS